MSHGLTHSLDAVTKRIGREIFDRADASTPSIWSMEHWQRVGLDWITRDEDLKLRVFRFIEVLPSLRSSASIARHLNEYLVGEEGRDGRLPPPLDRMLAFGNPGSAYAGLVSFAVRRACVQMARQFICGSTPDEAIDSVLQLRRRGMGFTLDVLGETVIADRVARAHQELYLRLITELGRAAPRWSPAPLVDDAPYGRLPRANVSLKLSAVVAKFDAIDAEGVGRHVLDRLRPILRAARDHGVFLNVDMEHHAVKDLTLDLFKRVLTEPEFRDWPDCGIVIQAYLTDAERDLRELIAWVRRRGTPIAVRLVKGAYWDYETAQSVLTGRPAPVFTAKRQSDVEFEKTARIMLEHADVIRPAFASHNVRSIAAAIALERALGLPPRTVELQMLTGMGEPLKRAVVEMNQRLRIYAPFGELIPGMAYLIRRLIENTSNESFLRQSFSEHTPIDVLLADPAASHHANGAVLPKPLIQDPDEYAEMNPFENEVEVDFSVRENRDAMEQALRAERARFGRACPAVIDGKPIETGRWFESLNPSCPTEVVGRTAECGPAEVGRAVAAARRALPSWSAASADERAAMLDRAADALHDRRFEAAALQVFEVGKTWREAHGDVTEAIDYLRFYAAEARRLAARTRRRDYPGETNEYRYEPRGVVAVLSPFCFPMALLTNLTSAALAAGNCCVVKPARAASVCGAWLLDVLNGAGLPVGVLNFVPGPGEAVGQSLVQHPDVDMIAFTGSSDVGSNIIEQCRRRSAGRTSFKHVVAEMGGKNAILVDDDADLDEAVQAVIASAFGYSGQKCTSCSRAVVVREAYDDFLSKLVEAARGIAPAAADRPGTTVGPLIDESALRRVRRYVEIGRSEARCVLGDAPRREPGDADAGAYFHPPVIFTDVPPDAVIAQEEIFGPVLAVIRAETFDAAIDIANGTRYALVAGVFSRSPSNIEAARRRLRAGNLYINRRITASRVDRQPFGGLGASGLGAKAGGPDFLLQFTVPRTICENTMRHGFAAVSGGPSRPEKTGVVHASGRD